MPVRRKHRVGDWLVTDDESGIVHYRSEVVKRWDGFIVSRDQYESRQPQEFVKAKTDPRAVSPIRPEAPAATPDNTIPRFIGSTNILTPLGPAAHLFDIRALIAPPGIAGISAVGLPGIAIWNLAHVDNQASAYLTRSGAFTSVTTSKIGMFALRLKLSDSGSLVRLFENADGTIKIQRSATDKLTVTFADAAALTSLDTIETNDTYSAAAGWINMLFLWDTDAAAGSRTYRMWVNDTEVALTENQTGPAFDPEFDNTGTWALGTDPASPGTVVSLCVSDFYVNNAETFDFGDQANRRLFYAADGLPENKGPHGEAPTGNKPLLFFNGDDNRWSFNRGYGGGFSRVGDFITCADIVAPEGIASTNAFGSPFITSVQTLSPPGIASTNAFGQPSIVGGPQFLDLDGAGIASVTAFGVPGIDYEAGIGDAIIGTSFKVR